ncbi:hypothetical protein GA0074692_0142 [Micromonospora pallida]|uniref:Uncharacterized protein n=1 Tax=Micromonospora pallida TaxID=145854 RepID=A0A1C6RJH9_9ACTN|nr:hypothetical protein GA0074692_0142 [Micromonospora pallida]
MGDGRREARQGAVHTGVRSGTGIRTHWKAFAGDARDRRVGPSMLCKVFLCLRKK